MGRDRFCRLRRMITGLATLTVAEFGFTPERLVETAKRILER